jgi:hypothetical protein
MKRSMVFVFSVCAALLAAGAYAAIDLWLGRSAAIFRIEGVDGPVAISPTSAPRPARISDFERGGSHRLAILVTDPGSAWLGLARVFRAQGIPFVITQDPQRAFQHKVVLVYPIISGRSLSPDALRKVAEHVHTGGTVLGFDLAGGGLESLFGVNGARASRARNTLHWAAAHGPAEEVVTVFSRAGSEAELGSYAFATQGASIVARYEDGGAAITCRRAVGEACLMGVDLGDLAQRAMDGRAEPIARFYVNQYEPSLDVLARWVRDLYVGGEPSPYLIDTAPPGRQVSIIFTHDVDYNRSVANSRAYAEVEHDAGIRATYFTQTKYVRDYNDDFFFTPRTISELVAWRETGMEIASHGVSHARAFKAFPLGSQQERYANYQPFVESRDSARDGTIFGETRVSKFLLEHFTGAHVSSFRPGHLSYPFNLPEVLQATGYSYSSSITADACLTHFPFQLTYARAGESPVPVWEFPITIEDEESPRLGDRVDAANDVISKIAANHGLVVILIHPDILDHKLAFERAVIARWRNSAWMTDLNTFGAWWRARDQAEIDLVDDAGVLTLTIRASLAVHDLAIIFPKANMATARGDGYQMTNGRLSIEHAVGERRIPISDTRRQHP